MMATPIVQDDFFSSSKKIAKNFLHSVVVIDDQATFETEIKPDTVIEVPKGRGGRIEMVKDVAPPEDLTSPELLQTEPLYVKQLNDCFADEGLICGVLKPTEEEIDRIAGKADHIARRADIIVFDWYLSKKEKPGASALTSIYSIINSDILDADGAEKRSRMRLIAVYTSFVNLHEIVEETSTFLRDKGLVFSSQADDKFVLLRDGVKIVFYRKDRGTKSEEDVQRRTVSESKLIDCLISDFTKMTLGLLSNLALDSFGALRNNTHRILRKFDRRLDPAYVSHRTMVTPSDEAQQHPIPLLTSEFNDVLEDCEVDKHISMDMIEKWIDHQIETQEMVLDKKIQDVSGEEVRLVLLDLIKNGVDAELKKYKDNAQKPHWKNHLNKGKRDKESAVTNLLLTDGSGSSRDLDFAMLTTMRSRYEKPEPLLTLGSIVAKGVGVDINYYVCIQPLCDSVRLTGDTVFPFLKLHDSTKPEGESVKDKFGIVVKDNGSHIKLRPILKPREIILFNLRKQHTNEVKASKNADGIFMFETVGDETNLRWIGDLKFPHAQRIANEFAREISRVGLVESDWLRRMNSL